jgi:hypothetical protein
MPLSSLARVCRAVFRAPSGRRLAVLVMGGLAVKWCILTPSLVGRVAEALNKSPFLGPLLLMCDVVVRNQWKGACLFVVLVVIIGLPVVKLRTETVVVSVIGVVLWIIVGIISSGIGA